MKVSVLAWIISLAIVSNAAEPIAPIPQYLPHNPAKAAVGRSLFFDPILSKDRTISCASCHNIAAGGADNAPVSMGVNGQEGNINTPTVFNAAFNFTQFWNGRAKNLQDQASGPMHNPVEMGMDAKMVEKRLNQHPHYQTVFQKITARPKIIFSDVTDALSEFEKTLITPNGKFDRYLRHETVLSPKEERGYENFKHLGCVSCHNGVNVGGNSYQKFGVIIPIPRKNKIDDRYAITKREQDKNVFKVPSLRNIALTAPYFHDGRASTLSEAINIMSHHNLGVPLSSDEIEDMIAFLNTLSGKLPKMKTQ